MGLTTILTGKINVVWLRPFLTVSPYLSGGKDLSSLKEATLNVKLLITTQYLLEQFIKLLEPFRVHWVVPGRSKDHFLHFITGILYPLCRNTGVNASGFYLCTRQYYSACGNDRI